MLGLLEIRKHLARVPGFSRNIRTFHLTIGPYFGPTELIEIPGLCITTSHRSSIQGSRRSRCVYAVLINSRFFRFFLLKLSEKLAQTRETTSNTTRQGKGAPSSVTAEWCGLAGYGRLDVKP